MQRKVKACDLIKDVTISKYCPPHFFQALRITIYARLKAFCWRKAFALLILRQREATTMSWHSSFRTAMLRSKMCGNHAWPSIHSGFLKDRIIDIQSYVGHARLIRIHMQTRFANRSGWLLTVTIATSGCGPVTDHTADTRLKKNF